jgi:hypothetical protein
MGISPVRLEADCQKKRNRDETKKCFHRYPLFKFYGSLTEIGQENVFFRTKAWEIFENTGKYLHNPLNGNEKSHPGGWL